MESSLVIGNSVEIIDWDAIYTSEVSHVYNYFLYKVGDQNAAQDLTAATFERAWKVRSKYKPLAATPSAWVFGIAKNVLREHYRGQKRKDFLFTDEINSDAKAEDEEVEKKFQSREESQRLRLVLNALPNREKDLIALKYGAELTNREIARITGISEGNVGNILFRTIKKIRNQMEESHGG